MAISVFIIYGLHNRQGKNGNPFSFIKTLWKNRTLIPKKEHSYIIVLQIGKYLLCKYVSQSIEP